MYRVLGIDNKDSVPSTRVKVILVTYSGTKVPRVRRAQAAPVKVGNIDRWWCLGCAMGGICCLVHCSTVGEVSVAVHACTHD